MKHVKSVSNPPLFGYLGEEDCCRALDVTRKEFRSNIRPLLKSYRFGEFLRFNVEDIQFHTGDGLDFEKLKDAPVAKPSIGPFRLDDVTLPSCKIERIEEFCCVYFLLKAGIVVYVGQSTNVYSRLNNHRKIKLYDDVRILRCERHELDRIESLLIRAFRPVQNSKIESGPITDWDIDFLQELGFHKLIEKGARDEQQEKHAGVDIKGRAC